MIEHGWIEADVGIRLVLSSLEGISFSFGRTVLASRFPHAVATLGYLGLPLGISPSDASACGLSLSVSRQYFTGALPL